MKQRKQLFQYVDSENPPRLYDLAGLKEPEFNSFLGELCEGDYLTYCLRSVQDIERFVDIFDINGSFDQLIDW